jgi:hypothetical protein
MKSPFAIFSSIFFVGCSVMGIRNSQQAPYQVLSQHGDVEIRHYGPQLLAETVIDADYAGTGRIGFNRLASFIFGNNQQKQSVAMTAPVLRQPTADRPISDAHQWRMAFVMPADYTLDKVPTPLDPLVTITPVPPKKVATLRYSGELNAERLAEKTELLLSWLQAHQHHAHSLPRSAAYDPPWTVPALRRNEIHIDID